MKVDQELTSITLSTVETEISKDLRSECPAIPSRDLAILTLWRWGESPDLYSFRTNIFEASLDRMARAPDEAPLGSYIAWPVVTASAKGTQMVVQTRKEAMVSSKSANRCNNGSRAEGAV